MFWEMISFFTVSECLSREIKDIFMQRFTFILTLVIEILLAVGFAESHAGCRRSHMCVRVYMWAKDSGTSHSEFREGR